MDIRKDDFVEVISGEDRGTSARVLRVLPDKNKVVVEGVNRVKKHMKPSARNRQGGRLSKEMAIDVSNVLLWCPSCRRGVRIGCQYDPKDGRKQRICKKCKGNLGTIGKARPHYAKKA